MFLSIKRAIEIKPRLEVFYYVHREELSEDTLSEEEWTYLKQIARGLYPFYHTTLRLEGRATNGHHGAIWEALPVLTYLLSNVEAGRQEWTGKGATEFIGTGRNRVERYKHHPMEVAYQNAWEKLTKYYNKTDEAHIIYAAAILLHPAQRKRWFDKNWVGVEAQFIPAMIENVKNVWREEYEDGEVLETQVALPIDPIDEFLNATNEDTVGDDVFDRFIHGSTIVFPTVDGVINWVVEEGNMPPSIRQQALDLLSIPAMSAELERVFSSARLTVTHLRNSLSAESIEMLELLRYWWVNNIVQQERIDGGRARRKRKAMEISMMPEVDSGGENTM
jgi:hypothetical protein